MDQVKTFLSGLICLLGISAFGQQDAYHTALLSQLQTDHSLTGGTWVFAASDQANRAGTVLYGSNTQALSVTGYPFSHYLHVEVPGTGPNPWDAGYILPNISPVQTGERVLLVVWMRASPSGGGNSSAIVSLYAEDAATYTKEVYLTLELDSNWKQYLVPFESQNSYPASSLNVGFHLSYGAQQVDIAGLTARNYAQTVPLYQLPTEFYTDYAGSSPSAPWRAQAEARIAQHRMDDMRLTIEDLQGNPVPNTSVRVEMLSHAFGFGSAITPRRLAGNPGNDPTYASYLQDLDGQGHGFNEVVTENALKWDAWEEGWVGSPAQTANALQWLDSQGIAVRGHVLLWPGWQYLPDDMASNAGSPTYLRNRIFGHLNDILNYPGVGDIVSEWDVVNEIAHVRDLENGLAGNPGYPTGREIYAEVLERARVEQSGLITYLNDYDILSNGSVNGPSYQLYKSIIQEVIDAGAPLDGIGMQAHMRTLLTPPDSLYAILEDCYQAFGRAIKITEYDLPTILADEVEAQYLGDFLTMVFSHPAVEAFLMWGFWDGAHWLSNAPLYYQDWTPKPAHATFVDLVFDRWWTDTTLTTDAQGTVDLRGFKGRYRITVDSVGTPISHVISHTQATDTTLLLFGSTALSQPLDLAFSLFPNPTEGRVSLHLPAPDAWTLHLQDMQGRVIRQLKGTGTVHTLDFTGLPAGTYVVRISQRGKYAHQLLVKP